MLPVDAHVPASPTCPSAPRDHLGPQDTQCRHSVQDTKLVQCGGGSRSSLTRAEQGTEIRTKGRGLRAQLRGSSCLGALGQGRAGPGLGQQEGQRGTQAEAEGTSKRRVHPSPAPGKAARRCMHDGGGRGYGRAGKVGGNPALPPWERWPVLQLTPWRPRDTQCVSTEHPQPGRTGPVSAEPEPADCLQGEPQGHHCYRPWHSHGAAVVGGTSSPLLALIHCPSPPALQEAREPQQDPSRGHSCACGRAAPCCHGSGAPRRSRRPQQGPHSPGLRTLVPISTSYSCHQGRPGPPRGVTGRPSGEGGCGPGFILRRQRLCTEMHRPASMHRPGCRRAGRSRGHGDQYK